MPPETSRASLQGVRVLVVEDEYFIADDLRNALAAQGAAVVGPAPSVHRASELLARELRFNSPCSTSICGVRWSILSQRS